MPISRITISWIFLDWIFIDRTLIDCTLVLSILVDRIAIGWSLIDRILIAHVPGRIPDLETIDEESPRAVRVHVAAMRRTTHKPRNHRLPVDRRTILPQDARLPLLQHRKRHARARVTASRAGSN
jgi:hypothetical protein